MTFSPRCLVIAAALGALSGPALAADSPASSAPAAAGPPACPAPDSKQVAYLKNPKWTRQPTGDDVTQVYPAFAYKEHRPDKTVVDCAVGADGVLQDCSVVEDQKPRQGFDKAALRLTRLYRMPPLDDQPAYSSLPACIRKLGAPHVVIPMDWSAGG